MFIAFFKYMYVNLIWSDWTKIYLWVSLNFPVIFWTDKNVKMKVYIIVDKIYTYVFMHQKGILQ